MATYEGQSLGALDGNGGKDYVTQFGQLGTLDLYEETLVGGVDYVIGAFGAENGGSLLDPAIVIFDRFGQLVDYQLDGGLAGFNSRDPLMFFDAPGLGVGQTDTFYIGVFDQAGGGGEYTLSVEGAGPPISFGSGLGTVFG